MSSSLYKAAVDGIYSLYSMANYDDAKDYLPTNVRHGAFGFQSQQPPDVAKPHSQLSCVFGRGARETTLASRLIGYRENPYDRSCHKSMI
jgi:hypothetical protein